MSVVLTTEKRQITFEDPIEQMDLRRRIEETAALSDRRGYGVPLETFARLMYGGPVGPDVIQAALPSIPGLALEEGLVIRSDQAERLPRMLARQASHRQNAAGAKRLADDFAGRLRSSCPLVRAVFLTGSASSGGFDPKDDVDLNIVARDGAKYTVYLWSIALSVVTSLRHRLKPVDEMSPLPFLPKIICVNVVWEEAQLHPFSRRDKWLAFELLLHRPLLGRAFLDRALEANAWLRDHYPQMFAEGFVGEDSPEAVSKASTVRRGRRLFEYLDRHRAALGPVEAVSRFLVIAVHRVVSLTRTHNPEAREREAFVNLVKRPYSVYDVPGRATPVPAAALLPR
jgi:hypothetical protein